MSKEFIDLGIRSELLEALQQLSYIEMTPIQEAALPVMLEGRDVIGQAMTGSGKTAAFGLALLQKIDPLELKVQSLVLCPTRELAEQVADELRRLSQRQSNTRILTLCGGHSNRDQTNGLKRGCHVVVGTPGRVGKHIRTEALQLDHLRILVLDEADRMLDMGFMDEVKTIIADCPTNRQTLLFSATFPQEIETLSEQVQKGPQLIAVETQVESDKLQQLVFKCTKENRNQTIVELLAEYRPKTALLFCETRQDCRVLSDFLIGRGASALALHGEMEQRDRDDVLLQFSNGSASVLVATNLAARGLDIPDLPFVLICELSPESESHLHRIGRTGRAGQEGLALSIVASEKEELRLEKIEEMLGYQIKVKKTPSGGGGLSFLQPPNRTLLILAGKKDKLRKGDVVGSLVKDVGIPPETIGRIDLKDKTCAVALSKEVAVKVANHLKSGRIKNKRVRIQLL